MCLPQVRYLLVDDFRSLTMRSVLRLSRVALSSLAFFARLCSGYTISNFTVGTPFEDPTGITSFSNGSAAIDLSLLDGAEIAIFWQFQANGSEPVGLGLTGTSLSSVEFISGTAAAAGNDVVDILGK